MHDLRIGDRISLDGRSFVVRGFDPMNIPEQTAQLEDTETGAISRAPVTQLPSSPTRRAFTAPASPPGAA